MEQEERLSPMVEAIIRDWFRRTSPDEMAKLLVSADPDGAEWLADEILAKGRRRKGRPERV